MLSVNLLFSWFFAIGGVIVIVAAPAFVATGASYFALRLPFAWLYRNVYTYNCFVDRMITKPQWRNPIGWALTLIPAVYVAIVMFYGSAASFFTWTLDLAHSREEQAAKEAIEKTPVVNLGTTVRRYELVDFNPPKNYYVSLRDVKDNYVIPGLRVATYCAGHENHKVGDQFNFKVTRYKQGEKEWITIDDLRTLCTN